MAIDLQKPDSEQYNDPNADAAVAEIYRHAIDMKKQGMPDYQIRQSLLNKGLDEESANIVLTNIIRQGVGRMRSAFMS